MSKEFDLVVVGNLAFQEEHLTNGTVFTTNSGSAYGVAAGASLVSKDVGVVARVGDNHQIILEKLKEWGVDTEGVKVVNGGKTPQFLNIQNPDGTRDFKAELGVASEVDTSIFPKSYLSAYFIHLSTNLPRLQLIWLENLKSKIPPQTIISADTFESFVRDYPDLTKKVLNKAGMVFANEEEWTTLNQFGEVLLTVPLILKKGPLGAVYIEGNKRIVVPAPKVEAVDTSLPGEVLAGVFLSLRGQGVSIEVALERAVNEASRSVTKQGVEHLHELLPVI